MRKKLEIQERAIYNAVTVYRERGNHLQRLDQFEKAINSYNEALKWNEEDVPSLLGRSLARAKATYYSAALKDAARAAELAPENTTALQIKAQTEYDKCAFERALVLAHMGQRQRKLPPKFAECARIAEESVRECTDESAGTVLKHAVRLLKKFQIQRDSVDSYDLPFPSRVSRMQPQPMSQVQEISRVEKQRNEHIARLMASKYLERMAHDKYFLSSLSKDERLVSANKQGSQALQQLADQALADVEKRQAVLRERRPLYAARAAESAARARLARATNARLSHCKHQYVRDAKRLILNVQKLHEQRETNKCLEQAHFALEQISSKPVKLLPNKDKYMQELHDLVAEAFLNQKKVRMEMSEGDREKRAFILLGLSLSREPSQDSVLKNRPPPPRDAKSRLHALERALAVSTRPAERCYNLHEIARLLADTKQPHRARFFASKCQSEARASNQKSWFINATFILARSYILQNNRPEARAALLEGFSHCKTYGFNDVAEFFETCANVSTEGEIEQETAELEKREKAVVKIMQDDDLKSAAQYLFRKMSTVPAARRFSIMPGMHVEDSGPPTAQRRQSIMPRTQQPVQVKRKTNLPLGYQEFDI